MRIGTILGLVGQSALFLSLAGWLCACASKLRNGACPAWSFDREASVPLRGLLVSIVVLGHLCKDYFSASSLSWPTAAVAVFMFLSGFGMMVSARDRKTWLAQMLPRTVKKLLVPLMLVMAVMVVFKCFRGELDQMVFEQYARGELVLSPYGWYVVELVLLAALFRCVTGIAGVGRHAILLLFAGAAVMFVGFRFGLRWRGPWWTSIFAFPIGATYALAERRVCSWLKARSGRNYLLLAAVAAVWAVMLPVIGRMSSLRVVLLVSALVTGVLTVIASYVLPIPSRASFLYLLGVYSLEIYLVHGGCRELMVAISPSCCEPYFAVLSVPASLLVALGLNRLSKTVLRIL